MSPGASSLFQQAAIPLSADAAPVRIGIAGLGRAGTYHLERLGLREDCRVVALYDDCPAALARLHPAARRVHETWSSFLADSQVELVLLAAPPALHAELAISALAAGKHVVIETPLCLNLVEADAIAASAARTGGQVSVAQTRRWSDDFQTVQAALAGGQFGEPQSIKWVNWQYNPRPHRPAHETVLIDKIASGETAEWRRHRATGGGLLWELGVHVIDQLLQLAGRPAESVFAHLAPSSNCDCDDAFLAVVNFAGGLVAHIEASRVAAAPLSTGWMIAGERGSYSGFTQYVPNRTGEVVDAPLTPVSTLPDEYYRQVVTSLRNHGPNPVPLEQARQTIALIEAVRNSARTGRVVAVER